MEAPPAHSHTPPLAGLREARNTLLAGRVGLATVAVNDTRPIAVVKGNLHTFDVHNGAATLGAIVFGEQPYSTAEQLQRLIGYGALVLILTGWLAVTIDNRPRLHRSLYVLSELVDDP